MNHVNLDELLKGKVPINVSIDTEANAIYFKVSDDEVLRTVRMNSSLTVDYGKDKEVVGIEIIRVKKINCLMKQTFHAISSALPNRILSVA